MFAARGIAVSFSVFVIVYCGLSAAVSLGWRKVHAYASTHPVRGTANILFALRILPLITAAVITAAFTVPSFLLFEPRAIDEPLGGMPLALAICGTGLALFGFVNAGLTLRRAWKTISGWTREAQPVTTHAAVPVLRMARTLPAMTAAGILRPRVLLSGTAEALLTSGELQTALNHEVAHIRRQDNLKKLCLRFVAFPGMDGLEDAWLEATEMAADDAAVMSSSEALDLAAALIKLSRLGPGQAVELTAALVHSPAAFMNTRVNRLVSWSDDRRVPLERPSPWYGVCAAAATIALFAITYTQLLIRVHTATEWLVR